MKNYVNFHCHTSMSNLSTPDSVISNEDRVSRVIELGQTVASFVEHGHAMSFLEGIPLSRKYCIKPLIGSEIYFVKDRFESDRTNSHLILLAKNEDGRKQINEAISEGNLTGFYYKPRLDFSLLFQINPKDIWITTACLGGIWKYEDSENILLKLKEHFGNSLFLEVQNHNVQEQKDLNSKIIELSRRFNVRIIAGMDSHLIYPKQAKERDDYLRSRGIEYPEEQNWYLDFPSYDDAFRRFEEQGILNKNQISDALENTNIFESVSEYDSIIFDSDIIKLPSIYPDKTQEEKDDILRKLIFSQWEIEKKSVAFSKWKHYEDEINKELSVIIETKMSDYFLLDYEIVKRGKELGGTITLTGRGSMPSYYTSKLLGLTTIDRISASVKLFPERFISKERLLETKSIPDVDLNLGTPQIFSQAQIDVMGENRSFPMIAFVKTRGLGAWKLYARSAGVDFETSNAISEQLQQFEFDLKHAEEDEKENIDALSYIDNKYHDIYLESKKYIGLINSVTPHPCASLITDFDIRKEFGLIKIKTGSVEHICACCDGKFAETYKLLKNDLLKVAVVDLIYRVYQRIGIKPHPLPELLKICENNEKVWNVYKNAWGMGINQVEQQGTIGRVAKYAPKNISELSAFVAAIRPSFKSNYKQFENREHFEYGIPSLDKLIQTKEFPESYMLYQENIMQVLSYAGIPISQTYEVIKNIAKKRVDKVLKYKQQFIDGMKKNIIFSEKVSEWDAEGVAMRTWKIIEDSAFYSFNASHSYSVAGDSLYGAYLKANYPLEFYETFLKMLEDDADKDRLALVKNEATRAFGIKFPSYKFGQDNRDIILDKKTNSISSSLKSIKGFNHQISEDLFELSKHQYNDFVDFLVRAEDEGKMSSKFEKLIKIHYFDNFGKNQKLLNIFNEFKSGKFRYGKKLKDTTKEKRIAELKKMFAEMDDKNISFREQIDADLEILGIIQSTYPKVNPRLAYVLEVNDKFAPRIQVYSIAKGTQSSLKIYKKMYSKVPFGVGDILYCQEFEKKPSVKFIDGEYVEDKDATPAWWLKNYTVVKDIDSLI